MHCLMSWFVFLITCKFFLFISAIKSLCLVCFAFFTLCLPLAVSSFFGKKTNFIAPLFSCTLEQWQIAIILISLTRSPSATSPSAFMCRTNLENKNAIASFLGNIFLSCIMIWNTFSCVSFKNSFVYSRVPSWTSLMHNKLR